MGYSHQHETGYFAAEAGLREANGRLLGEGALAGMPQYWGNVEGAGDGFPSATVGGPQTGPNGGPSKPGDILRPKPNRLAETSADY